jgi:hypothetical protein
VVGAGGFGAVRHCRLLTKIVWFLVAFLLQLLLRIRFFAFLLFKKSINLI